MASGSGAILDINANVDNSHGTITVQSWATLNLFGASIGGGVVNNYTYGSSAGIFVNGSATLDDVTLNNSGMVTVESGTSLTLGRTAPP